MLPPDLREGLWLFGIARSRRQCSGRSRSLCNPRLPSPGAVAELGGVRRRSHHYKSTTMKTILALAFCLFVASGALSAADIDARLLRFSGEIPTVANLVNLLDSNSFANPTKLSAALNKKNAFEYRAITPVEFPTSFDADGKPNATDKRDTGIIFSGDATVSNGIYDLNITFSLVERANTILYPQANGTTIAQPVFRVKKVQTAITTAAGDWCLLRLPDSDEQAAAFEPNHHVLLVRIRK
jgi:hypothetical protein